MWQAEPRRSIPWTERGAITSERTRRIKKNGCQEEGDEEEEEVAPSATIRGGEIVHPLFVGCYGPSPSTWVSIASATPSSSLVGSTGRPSATHSTGPRFPSPGRGPPAPASRGRSSCRRWRASLPPRCPSAPAGTRAPRPCPRGVEHVEERDADRADRRCARPRARPRAPRPALREQRLHLLARAPPNITWIGSSARARSSRSSTAPHVAARAVEVVGEQRAPERPRLDQQAALAARPQCRRGRRPRARPTAMARTATARGRRPAADDAALAPSRARRCGARAARRRPARRRPGAPTGSGGR